MFFILTFFVTLTWSLPRSNAVPGGCEFSLTWLSGSKPYKNTLGSATNIEQETPLPEATGLGTSDTMDVTADFAERTDIRLPELLS